MSRQSMLLELNHSQVRHAAIGHENYARTSEVIRARPKARNKQNYVMIVQARITKIVVRYSYTL